MKDINRLIQITIEIANDLKLTDLSKAKLSRSNNSSIWHFIAAKYNKKPNSTYIEAMNVFNSYKYNKKFQTTVDKSLKIQKEAILNQTEKNVFELFDSFLNNNNTNKDRVDNCAETFHDKITSTHQSKTVTVTLDTAKWPYLSDYIGGSLESKRFSFKKKFSDCLSEELQKIGFFKFNLKSNIFLSKFN